MLQANQKLSLLNLNSPANNQILYHKVSPTSNTSKGVPNPSPLISKYSKSADDLKRISFNKSLSMPLSSKMILSGEYPGYRPPNADTIPFVDDSIPYISDEPPMSLTPEDKTTQKTNIKESYNISKQETTKYQENSQNLSRKQDLTKDSNEFPHTNHLITIKIEPDKSDGNETKVLIHDNNIQVLVDNNKKTGNKTFSLFNFSWTFWAFLEIL